MVFITVKVILQQAVVLITTLEKISPDHKILSDLVCLLGFTADLTNVTSNSPVFSTFSLLSPTPSCLSECSVFSYIKEDLRAFD